jgi:hypothetical protein
MTQQRNVTRSHAKKSADERRISYCPKCHGRLLIESLER